MVTGEEAKRILEQQRERNRERQREFAESMRQAGYKRIQCYISGEAFEKLETLRQDTSTGEVVTSALMSYQTESPVQGTVEPPPPPPDDERIERLQKIKALKDAGWTAAQIADEFNRQGYPTPSGRGKWSKTIVHNQVSKNKDFFKVGG